ncbi:hypothetical protein DXG01_008613 [Tephrocybe rancida]|nr:hypothetical protein DXG01_008613 [Tephrocybe rancida]
MPRAKLYHTPEEKCLANNAKSKRSYQNLSPNSRSKKAQDNVDKTRDTTLTREEKRLACCMQGVEHAEKKWRALIGPSPYHYIERLFNKYLTTSDPDIIGDATPPVEELASRIQHYQEEILQLSGFGDEYKQSEVVYNEINGMVKMLCDLSSATMMESNPVLRKMHARKEFMYQAK